MTPAGGDSAATAEMERLCAEIRGVAARLDPASACRPSPAEIEGAQRALARIGALEPVLAPGDGTARGETPSAPAEPEDEISDLRSRLKRSEAAGEELRAALAAAEVEAAHFRGMTTKLLRSPLVPIRDYLRFRSARLLARIFHRNPRLSAKYTASAAKRDPKRFLTGEAGSAASAARRIETLREAGPIVSVPFERSLPGGPATPRIAVLLHVGSAARMRLAMSRLVNLPVPFDLITLSDRTDGGEADMSGLPLCRSARRAEEAEVPRIWRALEESHDLVLHLDAGAEGLETCLETLLGSERVAGSILSAFSALPHLGMVTAAEFAPGRPDPAWGEEFDALQKVAAAMGIWLTVDRPAFWPPSGAFWTRPDAFRPLAGTLEGAAGRMRTAERDAARLLFYACESAGYRWIRACPRAQARGRPNAIWVSVRDDLEWAVSDQMPSVLLPGTRAGGTNVADLPRLKDLFRERCARDLDAFLAGGERLALPASDHPRVSIVLVLYNQAELTLHCLKSIAREAGDDVEVVIIDNGSADRTAELLGRLDGARLVANTENLHFLRGVNRAAAEARGEYLLLLNNDARLLPGTLAAAVSRLDAEPEIGAVGGPIVLLDGSLQEAGSIVFADGSCLGYGRGRDPGEAEFRFRRDVDYCSGAFLMLRRDLWRDLGGFDEVFAPAYYEETDLCLRIWERGHRVAYDPDARIVHFEFGSSATSDAAIALQKANRETFVGRHGARLASRHLPSSAPPLLARQRESGPGRVLVIEDQVPNPRLGSGFPRSVKMVEALAGAGWSVTLFPTAVAQLSCDEAYRSVPRNVELTLGALSGDLGAFLQARAGFYDAVLVSRPHNMVRYRAALRGAGRSVAGLPVLYDAEALFSERDALRARLRGETERDAAARMEEELALVAGTRTVFSVSEHEARKFREAGHGDVRILSHALAPTPAGGGPEGRDGILFVGALGDDGSPNADSLVWFVEEVMPRLDRLIGESWTLNVAGKPGAPSVEALASRRVRLLGMVEDLTALYAEARIFVAPTRFAAGIPLKVQEAAAHGLPSVVTDLLAAQLGWQEGRDLLAATDPDAFARACADLWSDDALWTRIRQGGLGAVERHVSAAQFRGTLLGAFDAVRRRPGDRAETTLATVEMGERSF